MAEDQRGSKYLLITSLGALGVVFGDIGTSPLYAFRESFRAAEGLAVSDQSVLGILSLMFWALMLIVSIKYLIFVMRADNHGEGGILALTTLAAQGLDPSRKKRLRTILLLGLFGTALLYGDGVITPAISVLSAVEGLEVMAPGMHAYITPIAAVIVVALFLIQRQGTARVGAFFGPVMIVWFGVLALLGLVQVISRPRVLAAISPTYAFEFLIDNPKIGFLVLGAVVLVVTGSEALYADMGHFGRRPIRLAWTVLVMPALLLNYFGQGALLISKPEAAANPFYGLAPGWARIPLILLATAAAVIASQALISGAFSLTQHAIQLGYLPRMTVDHTSPREIGQVYLGAVNYTLMITCVAVVFAFGTSSSLAAAYGVAVTTTMVITSILLYVVMRYLWGWSTLLAGGLTTAFLVVDLAFFSANIVKVPQGGWFPLAVGIVLLLVMLTWKTGRQRLTARMRSGELPIERFIGSIARHPQVRVPGTAVYLFSNLGATPPPLLANLRHNEVIHETVLIVTVQWTDTPRVPRAKRATVHDLGEGFYQVLLRFGFAEPPDVPKALADVTTADFGFDADDAVYVVGHETVIPTSKHPIYKIRDRLFAVMHRNAASPVRFFGLPPERVIEVGVQVRM
jgi:KUP system potassium uptake protein